MFNQALLFLLAALPAAVTSCPLEPYCLRGPFGVVGGNYFTDYNVYQGSAACGRITEFTVYHDNILHGLTFTYGNGHTTGVRGQNCEQCTTETKQLPEGEYINKVTGEIGETNGSTRRIISIMFHTNLASYGPYGTEGENKDPFLAEVTDDTSAALHWISGWAGSNLDQVNFYFKCTY